MKTNALTKGRLSLGGSHWLGRQGSNLGMAASKAAALPLGYAPIRMSEDGRYSVAFRKEKTCHDPASRYVRGNCLLTRIINTA
jgi:hypothetical protein